MKNLDGKVIDRFGDPITISLRKCSTLGHFNEKNGEICIDPDQPKVGYYVVLIHELMHLAESILIQNGALSERISHEYISNAAPIGLAALVYAGALKDLTSEDVDVFAEEMMGRE